MLEINVYLALDSDIKLIFIFTVGFGLLNVNFVIVGEHWLIDNKKVNIFILKAKKTLNRTLFEGTDIWVYSSCFL